MSRFRGWLCELRWRWFWRWGKVPYADSRFVAMPPDNDDYPDIINPDDKAKDKS